MDKPEYLRSLGIRCLRWVLYAKRPLDIEELRYALATFDEGQNARDLELDSWDVIFGACANLVVEQESFAGTFLTVRPVHYSVQEYYTSSHQSLQAPNFQLSLGDEADVHTNLSAECLAHLCQPVMHLGKLEFICRPPYISRLTRDTFLQYAASCFDKHLLSAHPDVAYRGIGKLLASDTGLFRSILSTRAMSTYNWFADWLPSDINHDKFIYDEISFLPRGDSWASYANAVETWTASSLVAATDLLLLPAIRLEYSCQGGLNSALIYACRTQSAGKVDQLLAAGADVEYRQSDGRSPLLIATEHDDEDLPLLLIKKGANVMAQDHEGDGVLWRAARFSGPKVINALLEAGADPNHGNALAAAAYASNVENIRCLVGAGADIDAIGGHYGPALHVAITRYAPNLDMVTYLLDNGADVNLQHGDHGSPLLAALRYGAGHYDVFILLLRRGARLDVRALVKAASWLLVRELSRVLLELDEGPRYSAADIRAALVEVRNGDAGVYFREEKRLVTRLLTMRLLPSKNELRLGIGPEIKSLTTSIYETECEWVGDSEWEDERNKVESEGWEDERTKVESEGRERISECSSVKKHGGVSKRRPVLRKRGTRRKYAWFATRRRKRTLEIKVLHEHG